MDHANSRGFGQRPSVFGHFISMARPWIDRSFGTSVPVISLVAPGKLPVPEARDSPPGELPDVPPGRNSWCTHPFAADT
jgi:hypothetical protein